MLNRLSEEESDGGEVSGLSDVSWVCSASDGSSDSNPEPQRKVRPSHPDPPLEDGPTDVPAHAEDPHHVNRTLTMGAGYRHSSDGCSVG
ncbi:hypothetical protein NQZ68_025933 [Dissostichus eleginoides]|nr:hypothetical protein NQZ68_025933 [Dissostichus eleginoides]